MKKFLNNAWRVLVLLLALSFGPLIGISHGSLSYWWELRKNGDFMLDQMKDMEAIWLRKISVDDNLVHSCYEYKLVSTENNSTLKSNIFCYPSIIVTGVRKCSTSAIYGLM